MQSSECDGKVHWHFHPSGRFSIRRECDRCDNGAKDCPVRKWNDAVMRAMREDKWLKEKVIG